MGEDGSLNLDDDDGYKGPSHGDEGGDDASTDDDKYHEYRVNSQDSYMSVGAVSYPNNIRDLETIIDEDEEEEDEDDDEAGRVGYGYNAKDSPQATDVAAGIMNRNVNKGVNTEDDDEEDGGVDDDSNFNKNFGQMDRSEKFVNYYFFYIK